MSYFRQLIHSVLPYRSAWRLGASGSAEVDVGTEVARVYVAGGGGTFYMGMGDKNLYFPYNYGGIGGGIGISLAIPVSASVSTPDMPSTGGEFGRLYVVPRRLKDSYIPQYQSIDVDKASISGPAVLMAPSVSLFGAAGGLSIIFFGMENIPNPQDPISMINGCSAIAFQAGLSMITPGLGVNCTLMKLRIFQPGAMVKK